MVGITRGFPNVVFSRYRDELVGMVTDNGIFPLRVIDLRETIDSEGGIGFSAPTDWNFHTISHTWSLYIRQLSKEVGGAVQLKGTGSAGSCYEDIFKHTKLGDRPGYAHLVEFLKMLQADGVERVWFDALCINQTDEEDKSREIAHMGAFYYHSLGCYVVAHGFGRGYQMMDDIQQQLPRWFSRAWTLQELLLPRSLSFVVELGNEELHGVMRATRFDHVMGHCDCNGEAGSAVWPWGFANPMLAGSRWSEHYDERVRWFTKISNKTEPVDSEEVREFWRQLETSGYRCTRGRFQRVAYQGLKSRSRVEDIEQGGCPLELERVAYFVDRDAFVYILNNLRLQRESGIPLAHTGRQRHEVPGNINMEDNALHEQMITELMRRFERLCGGGHAAVVREISMRECSNEEDRVLSVLALLGLDGKMPQLRTQQTLAQQMVHMCSTMAKHNVGDLIKLCMAFVRPNVYSTAAALISWAPHFQGAIHAGDAQSLINAVGRHTLELEHLRHLISDFHHTVCRVSVSPRGLSLSCHMLKGKLIPAHQHAQCCTMGAKIFTTSKVGCCICLESPQPEHCFILQIAHGHALIFNPVGTRSEELVLSAGAIKTRPCYGENMAMDYFEGGMVLNLDTEVDPHRSIAFNVWLLLLGTCRKSRAFSDYARLVLVFMVCGGESRENLHKIGIVQILPTYTKVNGWSTIHLECFENVQDCTVGGFGKREYNSWILKQLQASRLWHFT